MAKPLDSQGQDFINAGEAQSAKAFADRTPYSVSVAIRRQQALADSDMFAPDSLTLALKAENLAKAGQQAGVVSRNADSSTSAILSSIASTEQQNAADRAAAVAGAQHHQQIIQNDQLATHATNEAEDQQYELNVQQPFELSYQAGQNKINSGFQAKIQAAKNKASKWASGIGGIGNVAGSVIGGTGGGGSK